MAESIIKSGRKVGFTTITNPPIKDLSLQALGLYTVMQSRPQGWQFSVSGLAAFVGVSKDTIRKCLREMETTGYLVREQKHEGSGKFCKIEYTLYDVPQPLSENTDSGENRQRQNTDDGETGVREKPMTVKQTQPSKDLNQDRLKPTPIPPAGVDEQSEMFERFWKAYPRHDAKAPARKAWMRLKPDIQLCRTMAAALEQQKQSEGWQRDNGRYIPMPATWINQRRWEDELTAQNCQNSPQPDDERRGRFL